MKTILNEQKLHLFNLISKWRLYPSGKGLLHSVKEVEKRRLLFIRTDCGINLHIRNSKKGRAARWLRNGWYRRVCRTCKIPKKKLNKYLKHNSMQT